MCVIVCVVACLVICVCVCACACGFMFGCVIMVLYNCVPGRDVYMVAGAFV